MECDKILPNEVVGGAIDDYKNAPTQEGDDYNTESLENNYNTSVQNLPLIRHICNVF